VLGAERQIIADYVNSGRVRLVFWPILDLGRNSVNAAVTAFCAGEQDPAAFWAAHDTLFAQQAEIYGADRDTFLALATNLGLDGPTFEACYDGDTVRAQLAALDDARRRQGITQRPTFDLVTADETQRLFGAQPYDSFAAAIDALLP
jgi:protein-disulfide isomerase